MPERDARGLCPSVMPDIYPDIWQEHYARTLCHIVIKRFSQSITQKLMPERMGGELSKCEGVLSHCWWPFRSKWNDSLQPFYPDINLIRTSKLP